MISSNIFTPIPNPVKFAVVGVIGTFVNLSIMALLVEMTSTSITFSSLIATETAIIHNFLLNNYWTFRPRKLHNSLIGRCIRFHFVALVSLIINVVIALFLVRLGIWYLAAQACGILSAWFVNYLSANLLVFNDAAPS